MNTTIRRALIAATTATIGVVSLGAASVAADEGGPTFPPRTEECKVPPALFIVAAQVDPDSLEGCGYFEDPNYFDNRREAGIYNPNGIFSILFG